MKSGKSSAAEGSATETDATENSPRKKAKKGKKRKTPATDTEITATETDASPSKNITKRKKKAARKIIATETEATSATETETVATQTDASEASPNKIKKPLVSPEDAQASFSSSKTFFHMISIIDGAQNRRVRVFLVLPGNLVRSWHVICVRELLPEIKYQDRTRLHVKPGRTMTRCTKLELVECIHLI